MEPEGWRTSPAASSTSWSSAGLTLRLRCRLPCTRAQTGHLLCEGLSLDGSRSCLDGYRDSLTHSLVGRMGEGEEVELIVQPSWGYGEAGDVESGVPAGAALKVACRDAPEMRSRAGDRA